METLVAAWIGAYNETCSRTTIALEECGSTCGARHICDEGKSGDKALDVSLMDRAFLASEATTENGFIYDCAASQRKVIQVQVANEALVFAVAKDGVAGECMSILGGLTLHQLRWMYSAYNRTQLLANGWDPSSVQNDDLNDATHLWSELHADCAAEEIMIAGGNMRGSHAKFKMAVMGTVTDEDVPFQGRAAGTNGTVSYFHDTDNAILNNYVRTHHTAISFFMYSYAVDVADGLTIVHIQNPAGEMVRPDAYTIASGDYPAFSSPLYMNILNEDHVLNAMRPFFQFAFSETGTDLVRPQGFVPLGEWQKTLMLTALNTGGVSLHDVECGTQAGSIAIAGSNAAFPITKLWADLYMDKCSNVKISYYGGTSTQAADRVCAASSNFSRVDIGVRSVALFVALFDV
jgi:ABC-type phosphate transport system substrate-binding protein